MTKKIILLSIFILSVSVFIFGYNFVSAQTPAENISFFYSNTCPHCKAEKRFLEDLEKEFPQIKIDKYEIIYSSENREILQGFYEKYNVPAQERGRVPATFTSKKYFIGFNDQIGQEIRGCVESCLGGDSVESSKKVELPIFGEIDISQLSLPALAAILGFSDGLNPCAMWVLIFLLSILINTQSKKRIWLIGGTFILASGFIYFLVMSAWLNLFLAISYVTITRILVGVFALGIGIWQIKNFITYNPGVCKVIGISSRIEKKMNLTERTEKLATAPLTLGIIGGLIFLAFAVNLIEFFCSAGLPAIFTRILTLSQLDTFTHYLYILLYVFFFMLDDLIVFSVAAFTLSHFNFSEKYNYWSTLIGGILILVLGLLLVFKPELLMFA
jgi:glutaredoxin